MSIATGKALVDQVRRYFHRLPETRYYLSVVSVSADQQYHYFFYIRRKGVSTRSIPLGQESAKLENVKSTLRTFRQTYQLPIRLSGFTRSERQSLYDLTR